MNDKLRYAAIALAIASLAGFGCSKDKEKAKSQDGPAVAGAKSGFAVLPGDAEAVGGVNPPTVVSSQLWKRYGAMLPMFMAAQMNQFKAVCGFDPMQTIESVITAGKMGSDDGVVVIKGIDRKTAIACAEKWAKAQGETLTITEEGNLTQAVDSTGSPMYFGWLGDETLVLAPKTGRDKERMSTVMSGGDGLDDNKEMMDLLGNVDTSAALWGVARNTTGRNMGPVSATALYGSISLAGGLAIDAGIRQENADKAREVAGQLEEYVKPFAGTELDKFAKKVKIKTNGADVIVQLSLSDGEVQELIQLAMKNPELGNMMRKFAP